MKRFVRYTRVTGQAILTDCNRKCDECILRFYCFTEPRNKILDVDLVEFTNVTKKLPSNRFAGKDTTIRF